LFRSFWDRDETFDALTGILDKSRAVIPASNEQIEEEVSGDTHEQLFGDVGDLINGKRTNL
jgi:hypothetical protein